jgi:hypothetical protein
MQKHSFRFLAMIHYILFREKKPKIITRLEDKHLLFAVIDEKSKLM